MQNFMELDMKTFSDPKALTFRAWGQKTSLKQFGPKDFAFGKGLIQPLVENLSSNFHKQDLIFSGVMRWDESNKIMKLQNKKKMKKKPLGVWGLETTFGPHETRRHIQPYFQNSNSNFHEQELFFSKIMR